MAITIEKPRVDIAKQREDIEWDTGDFIARVILGAAACVGAGGALATLVLHPIGKI